MVASDRLVRWLCWSLVVLVIISAVFTLGFALGIFYKDPGPIDDFVARLEAVRQADQAAFPFVLMGSLATFGVFLVATMLGVALRALAPAGGARDVMTTVFIVGGIVGVLAQLANIGVGQVAAFGYCDCGYRVEELIAQDYALFVGWSIQEWLAAGAITIVGVGAALAGRLIDISPAWTTLSYLIAVVLLVAVAVQVVGFFIHLENIDLRQITDLVIGLVAGVAVPIWAILLARGARQVPEPGLSPA